MSRPLDRYRGIQRKLYERSEQLIVSELHALRRGDGALRVMDVGCSTYSIALQAIEGSELAGPIELDLIDNDEQVRAVYGAEWELPADGPTSGTIPDRGLSWRFHRLNFVELALRAAVATPADDGRPPLSAEPYDLIVLHSVLHELYRHADGATPAMFFTRLFGRLATALRPGARVFVADPYYPGYADPEPLMRAVYKIAGHADPPVCFLHPEQILNYVLRPSPPADPAGLFTLRREETHLVPLPGVEGGRKFYTFVLERRGEGHRAASV